MIWDTSVTRKNGWHLRAYPGISGIIRFLAKFSDYRGGKDPGRLETAAQAFWRAGRASCRQTKLREPEKAKKANEMVKLNCKLEHSNENEFTVWREAKISAELQGEDGLVALSEL